MKPLGIYGITNGWVLDDVVWRGAQPDPAAYLLLAKAGCKTVMSLRPLTDVPGERAMVEAVGMEYRDMNWNGIAIPSQAEIVESLATIRESRDTMHKAPTYVHCQHGKDRTGTLCACWRVSEYGWSWEHAMLEAVEHGQLEDWMEVAVVEFARNMKK